MLSGKDIFSNILEMDNVVIDIIDILLGIDNIKSNNLNTNDIIDINMI